MRRACLKWFCLVGGLMLSAVSPVSAAQIWESTFDSSADGVVDVFNNNAGKDMIGTAAGGRLPITVWDNSTNSFTPDKAGRALGTTLNGNNSMSARYKFNWSTLNQVDPQAHEAFGFLGNSSPQTRQILGGIFRHWKVNATTDHYVALDIAAGGGGFSSFGYQASGALYIGSNPTANDYELQIEYDGSTHVLSLDLLDSGGTSLLTNSADLDTLFGGSAVAELNSFMLTHLGWSDYTGNGGDRATVWQVDSLAYYDTSQVPIPEPTAMALILLGFAGIGLHRRRR